MDREGKQEIRVSSRKEREARQKSRRFAGWRRKAARYETGWDRKPARIWGGALVFSFFLPLSYQRVWQGGGRFTFLWDTLDGAGTLTVVSAVLPVVLGAAAIGIAAHRNAKVRGYLLLAGALLASIVPLFGVGPPLLGAFSKDARSLVAIALVAMLAPPVIAAGNRVSRRTERDLLCRWLVGLGGLAMLLAMCLPIGPDDKPLVLAVLASRGAFEQLAKFPIIVWMLILVSYAAVATLHLHVRLDTRKLGDLLSLGARVALWWLPCVFLLSLILLGFGRGFLPKLLVFAGLTLRLYGVMILTALGLALVLDRRPPAPDPTMTTE